MDDNFNELTKSRASIFAPASSNVSITFASKRDLIARCNGV